MILGDYHVHTHLSTDSETLPVAQVEAAIKAGLQYLCFTDHQDIDYPELYDGPGQFLVDMERYQKELVPLAEAYRDRISIHLGIELGLQPHLTKEIPAFAASYPFEYTIGSTHVASHMDMYYPNYWEEFTVHQGILRYYEETLENIRKFDCFDCYGHLDYIIRYVPKDRGDFCTGDYRELIDEILKTLIAKGKGIECNTAGFKYGLGHPNPHEDILRRYFELGGEILTIGSDGHKPEHVAYDFEKLPELLKACGAKYYTIFKERKPEFLPL